MTTQIFINERSLHGQFAEYNIKDAIKNFIAVLKFINSQKFTSDIFTTKLFFNIAYAYKDEHIGAILENNQSLKSIFFHNIRNVSKWENERMHDLKSTYIYNKEDYVGSSVAELAERKLTNRNIKEILLNFQNSKFAQSNTINICKNGNIYISISCSFDEDSISECFIHHGLIDPKSQYDIESKYPPRDFQTVLRDNSIFTLTTYLNQNRKVYERLNYGQLWAVDNLHYGTEAHIEVFDKVTGSHLGTSQYDKIEVETKYKENGRSLF